MAIGFEHVPPKIDLSPLIKSFEVIARDVARISLFRRCELKSESFVHPIHQAVRLFAWEVLGSVPTHSMER